MSPKVIGLDSPTLRRRQRLDSQHFWCLSHPPQITRTLLVTRKQIDAGTLNLLEISHFFSGAGNRKCNCEVKRSKVKGTTRQKEHVADPT